MLNVANIPIPLMKKRIDNKLDSFCQENDIKLLAIFGSFATGKQHKKSDVDILIQFEVDKEKSLLNLVRLQFKLQRILGRKVDLVTTESLDQYIKDNILNNMRVIYEG
jgi:uncharacterized protein